MRSPSPAVLLLFPTVLLTGACSREPAPPPPVFVREFVDRSGQVSCRPVPELTGEGRSVGLVRPAGDTGFVVVYPLEREIVSYGADLRVRRRVPFRREGPGGILDPRDVVLVGDSLLYVADRPRAVVKVLDLEGGDRGTLHLGVPPDALAPVPGGLAVVPLILGDDQEVLLHLVEGEELRDLGIPVARFPDWRIQTLANIVAVGSVPGGRLVVAHRFLVPVAYLVDPGAGASGPRIRAVPVPLSDGVRGAVGRVPGSPFTEEELQGMLVSVLAMTPDPATGDLLYLTRSGRRRGDVYEKAVVRVDGEFRYRRSYLLDVNAGHLAYLSGEGVSLVVDDEDRWFRCPTP